MQTYTVFNIDDEDAGDTAGLGLEAAVEKLLELSGFDHAFQRVDGVMVMRIEPWPWSLLPALMTSRLPSDDDARAEILRRFITGEAMLPSVWCVEADDVFTLEVGRA